MSTRGSLFFHYDESSGVTIHIYEEALDGTLHVEVEHLHGCTNVAWPMKEFVTEVLDDQREAERWRDLAEPRSRGEWNLDALSELVRELRSKHGGVDSGS